MRSFSAEGHVPEVKYPILYSQMAHQKMHFTYFTDYDIHYLQFMSISNGTVVISLAFHASAWGSILSEAIFLEELGNKDTLMSV